MTKPIVDVKALANLARLEVSEAELEKLQTEIPGILAFVDTIQKAATPFVNNLTNVSRPGAT